MGKGIIISAFATCGKTYLANKYKNVIDMESSNYKFDNSKLEDIPTEERKGTVRPSNPNWPQNYYDAIIEATNNYDIVLVQLKPEHFDYFDKNNIKYSIAYPNLNNFDEIRRRCVARGNNEQFIKRLGEVIEPFYKDAMNRPYEKLYILNNKETLEERLLKDNINLMLK